MPHLNASYAPPGEDAATLWLERSALDGTFVECVAYGMLLLLFVQCCHVLLRRDRFRESPRWGLLAYTTAIFTLATIALGSSLKWNELVFIDQRNYPGGPSTFSSAYWNYWVTMMSSSCFIVLNWFADALLIYRFYIICSLGYWSLVPPLMMYVASIVTSILVLVFTVRADSGFSSEDVIRVGTAYWSLTVSLNVIITMMICFHLLRSRRKVRAIFGDEHGELYTRVTTMFVESAALYSIWGIMLVIAVGRGDSGMRNIFQGAIGHVQGIATLLIVVRVGQGRSYTTRASASDRTGNTLEFVEHDRSRSNPSQTTECEGEGDTTAMVDLPRRDSTKSAGSAELRPHSLINDADSRVSIEIKAEV
ncbi:hypothetical protein FIBSPDRAFT_818838 [Athelia psychrophila]|uniref:Uncharacterized protein n=1 Tax=Athelia psychrophila TaxID=1759441 RepID=A0A166Q9X7_9AGAM|nr:hypothetical protein FIBSPDRAFT_818838 [Fibularhizoctonia sp. CBS 109695]